MLRRMTVGHAVWPDQLDDAERAELRPGIPERLERAPDVLVVGGGILGCATAAACLRVGLGSVVVLERDVLGAGASGGAAGLLMPESHDGMDAPELVDLGRLSLGVWRELEASWPGGVGLLPMNWNGHPQARVNPLRALARVAAGLPYVATGVGVRGVTLDGSGVAREVHTSAGTFRPRNVVFATGLPPRIDGLPEDIPSHEVKGHILASAPTSLTPPTGLVDSVRKIEEGRLLVGGTLDVDDAERIVRPEVIRSMWTEVAAQWPAAAGISVEYQWACFRPAHADLLPVIDRVPGVANAWMTSGHYKTGILMAPATGRAIAEWIASGARPAEIQPFGLARLKSVILT